LETIYKVLVTQLDWFFIIIMSNDNNWCDEIYYVVINKYVLFFRLTFKLFQRFKEQYVINYTFRTKFIYLLHKSVFKSNATLHIKLRSNEKGEGEVLIWS